MQTSTVDLVAAPSVGIPTLKQNGHTTLDVNLNSTASPANPIVSYAWDFDGSGTDALTCYSHAGVSASYEQVGLYLSKITVRDTEDNAYSDIAIVNVINPVQFDSLFKQIWNGMKTALGNADIPTALGYFAESSKESFQQQFAALATVLPQYAASLGNINLVSITTNFAEYDFRTVYNNKIYSFQLLFVKDVDGSWKIRSF